MISSRASAATNSAVLSVAASAPEIEELTCRLRGALSKNSFEIGGQKVLMTCLDRRRRGA